ncbi:hypothetical protein [Qipengyuania nanhaisediminis]|uniref:hypothetical protein n=1 Tax=Qipengyuania nanhaisediminis TaxID=604088 RepID=UPI0038B2616F
MIEYLALAAATTITPQTDEQSIIEEAYSPGTGRVTICGFDLDNFEQLLSILEQSGEYTEENSTEEYRVFNGSPPNFRQLVVARPRPAAYPMVYCRQITPKADGTSQMQSSMHCQGVKSDCDGVFIEFRNHDQEILRAIGA